MNDRAFESSDRLFYSTIPVLKLNVEALRLSDRSFNSKICVPKCKLRVQNLNAQALKLSDRPFYSTISIPRCKFRAQRSNDRPFCSTIGVPDWKDEALRLSDTFGTLRDHIINKTRSHTFEMNKTENLLPTKQTSPKTFLISIDHRFLSFHKSQCY